MIVSQDRGRIAVEACRARCTPGRVSDGIFQGTIAQHGCWFGSGMRVGTDSWLNVFASSVTSTMPLASGSAFAEFTEQEKGRLAPGYLADLAVLSQDVLDEALPAQALPGTSSLLTMIGGKVAWHDPARAGRAARGAAVLPQGRAPAVGAGRGAAG